MKNPKKGSVKLLISFVLVYAVRLLPFRPPNVEPLVALAMPVAKGYGSLVGAFFAGASILLFDLFTSGLGWYTLVTMLAYSLVIALAPVILRGKSSWWRFALLGAFLTVLYDALTGLTIGPIFYRQPFMEALVGQIPFTAWHLLGNSLFSMILSPMVEQWVLDENRLEADVLIHSLSAKLAK